MNHLVCRAFSGKYVNWKDEGVFTCIVCGNQLFSSDKKFDSKSGWPSFYDVVEQGKVKVKEDVTQGKFAFFFRKGGY